MKYIRIEPELKHLCDIIVAGLKRDLSILPNELLDGMLIAFGGNKEKVLEFAEKAANEEGQNLANDKYVGGRGGTKTYPKYNFKYLAEEGEGANIQLTEERVRQISEGSLDKVDVQYLTEL